jgi:hypothetical protein
LTLLALAGLALNVVAWTKTFVAWLQSQGSHERQRKAYLEAVDRLYQVIPLVIDPDVTQDLPSFVYQRLRYQSDPSRPLVEALLTEANPVARVAADILQLLSASQTRSAIILGRPGGGKTTFLRHSMCLLAKGALRDISVFPPVFISLPRFAPPNVPAGAPGFSHGGEAGLLFVVR